MLITNMFSFLLYDSEGMLYILNLGILKQRIKISDTQCNLQDATKLGVTQMTHQCLQLEPR